MSLAKARKLQLGMIFFMSLINNAKRKGERWPPWGTPEVIGRTIFTSIDFYKLESTGQIRFESGQ